MSPKHIYAAVGILALALIGGMALHAYIGTLEGAARHDQLKQDIAEQVKGLEGRLESKLEAIKHDENTVKTPLQVAQAVPRYTPDVRPILIIPNGPQTIPSSSPAIKLEDAPSKVKEGDFIIPREQVPAYWASVTKCAKDSAQLEACSGKLPLETKRANDAETQLKGGGFWRRLKSNGKWLAIGSALGAGAVVATRR